MGVYKTKTDAYLIDVSDLYTGSQTVFPVLLTNETISEELLKDHYMNLNIVLYQLQLTTTEIIQYLIKIKKMIGIFLNLIKKEYFKIIKNTL